MQSIHPPTALIPNSPASPHSNNHRIHIDKPGLILLRLLYWNRGERYSYINVHRFHFRHMQGVNTLASEFNLR